MKPIIIKSTPISPSVIFDPNKGRFEFSGHSRPEDCIKFFTPLIDYIHNYQKKIINGQIDEGIKSNNFSFIFKFGYINSASTKFLCEFLFQVIKFKDIGVSFTIDWFYEKNDQEMRELGEEVSDIIEYPFSYNAFIPEE